MWPLVDRRRSRWTPAHPEVEAGQSEDHNINVPITQAMYDAFPRIYLVTRSMYAHVSLLHTYDVLRTLAAILSRTATSCPRLPYLAGGITAPVAIQ